MGVGKQHCVSQWPPPRLTNIHFNRNHQELPSTTLLSNCRGLSVPVHIYHRYFFSRCFSHRDTEFQHSYLFCARKLVGFIISLRLIFTMAISVTCVEDPICIFLCAQKFKRSHNSSGVGETDLFPFSFVICTLKRIREGAAPSFRCYRTRELLASSRSSVSCAVGFRHSSVFWKETQHVVLMRLLPANKLTYVSVAVNSIFPWSLKSIKL